MASVRLTDIYNRDLLASYIDRDSLEKLHLLIRVYWSPITNLANC